MKRIILILIGVLFAAAGMPIVPTPIAMAASTPAPHIVKVATGAYSSAALRDDGSVWTWGSSSSGQIGNNSTTDQQTPLRLTSLPAIADISAAGNHMMALDTAGQVWMWGDNGSGALGDGSSTDSRVPKQVGSLPPVAKIATGDNHSLALTVSGVVYGWGLNDKGQIDASFTNRLTPVPVSLPAGANIQSIAAGYQFSLALDTNGMVYAWGDNAFGQTAGGSLSTPVAGLSGIASIRAGQYHSLALTVGGAVYAWGGNSYGQVGNNTIGTFQPIVQVFASDVSQIFSGENNSFAIKQDGTLLAWGNNTSGQLGFYSGYSPDLSNKLVPTRIQAATLTSPAIDVASGTGHTLALQKDGIVKAAGAGMNGQLGAGAPFNMLGAFTAPSMPYAFFTGMKILEPSMGLWTNHIPAIAFKPDTFSYSLSVSGQVWSLAIDTTTPDSNEKITINGQPPKSIFTSYSVIGYQVPLSVGSNTIDITIQSLFDSSTVQSYTLQVTRAPDTTPPSFVAIVPNSDVNRIQLQFDEPLDRTAVKASGFHVLASGVPISASSAVLDSTGMGLTLQLSAPIPYDSAAALSIEYGTVCDVSGNPIAVVSDIAVPNSNPKLAFAAASADGNQIHLYYDRPLDFLYSLNKYNFSVYKDSLQQQGVDIASVSFASATEVVLQLTTGIATETLITLNIGQNAVLDENNQPSLGTTQFPVLTAPSLSALLHDLDIGADGLHIDDLVKSIGAQHDATGEGIFNKYDVQFILKLLSPQIVTPSS